MSGCKILNCPVHGVPCRSAKIADCAAIKKLDAQIEELLSEAATPRIFVPAPPHLRPPRNEDDEN